MNTFGTYLSDEELLQRFYKDSDNHWLGMLLQRYTLLMLGVCMKYLNNEADAKDAVQEILVRVLTDIKKHRVTYFKSWIYRLTVNHCLVKIRKNKHTTDIKEVDEAAALAEDIKEKEHIAEKEIRLNLLDESMKELNEDQRRCVELFYLENKSYKEIENITGFNAMQVKSFIQNGKRNPKLLLEKKQSK